MQKCGYIPRALARVKHPLTAALRDAAWSFINLAMNQIDGRPLPATAQPLQAVTLDLVQARNRMVDTQIRPLQVNDARIVKAMRLLPRERFVPEGSAAIAYADRPVRLDAGPSNSGRVLMEPRIIARMLQVSVPRAGEKVLVVAAGTGYSSALLEALGLRVVALEQDEALAARGARLCAELAPGVRFEVGPLAAGWPAGAPYDLIVIDGGVRALPEALAGQLSASGRLATVLLADGKVGTVVLAEASTHGLRARPQFDANTALIPELAPAPRFDF